MRLILILSLLFHTSLMFSDGDYSTVDIGILSKLRPESGQVITESGAYAVIADGKNLATLRRGDRVSISYSDNRIKVSFPGKMAGFFKDVRLMALNDTSWFRIFLFSPQEAERVYDDHLLVKPIRGCYRLVNRVSLEKYIAGVVEAESGKEKSLEFYKVQAIISRTYALSNRKKYAAKGYNLSDGIDSQVYHGKARWEPLILRAVEETVGKVLVDSEMRLITAAFHSNSGGETVGSETVWSGPLPYLSARRDEFSRKGMHYRWEEKMHKHEWLQYLEESHGLPVEDERIAQMALNYEQDSRMIYFIDPVFNVPLTEIRKDLGLNSTFFSVECHEDTVRFIGRGFGHGAGLSQEGAMRMSDLGFSHIDILHFYYDDVHVIDLRALEFFLKE